jgi:hypothetical protein
LAETLLGERRLRNARHGAAVRPGHGRIRSSVTLRRRWRRRHRLWHGLRHRRRHRLGHRLGHRLARHRLGHSLGHCLGHRLGHRVRHRRRRISWHAGVLRIERIAGHHLRRIWLARGVHGLRRAWIRLLVLSIERSCVDREVLRGGGAPSRMLRGAPSNVLRSRLEWLRVIPALLVCFPLAIRLVFGGDRAGPGHTGTVFAICSP